MSFIAGLLVMLVLGGATVAVNTLIDQACEIRRLRRQLRSMERAEAARRLALRSVQKRPRNVIDLAEYRKGHR